VTALAPCLRPHVKVQSAQQLRVKALETGDSEWDVEDDKEE